MPAKPAYENLLVVDDSTNQAKSDKGPAEWMPPQTSYWCLYAEKWKYIKDKYKLSYEADELQSLKEATSHCGE